MTWTDLASRVQTRYLPFCVPRRLRIRTKLLAVMIPSVVAILLVTGYLTYFFSQQFLQTALERIGIVQTLALAKAMEDTLAQGRRDLLFFANQPPDQAAMASYLERINALRPFPYREFGYLDMEGGDHVYLSTEQGHIIQVPGGHLTTIHPSPFQLLDQGRRLKPGQVQLGGIERLDFHLTLDAGEELTVASEVYRLSTPRVDATGKVRGLYILSLGARDLRKLLSLYNSAQSPIYGFERSPEIRYSFLFDTEGWVLFQSEEQEHPRRELTTYLARSGYAGTLGRRGMESAFRPESRYKNYWHMVSEVREGKSGIIDKADTAQQNVNDFKAFYMPYAPVRFQASETAPPEVVAGVANMDKSRMTLRAGYKQVDVVFLITLASTLVVTGLIALLARAITRPIIELSHQVNRIELSGKLDLIRLPDYDHETSLLKNAINNMIQAIQRQWGEIQARDQKIEQVQMRERASLNPAIHGRIVDPFPEIKGAGPLMERLKADLAKAAQVDADVLITGETGTGKQLVAEAIHRHSRRASRPFISINCGALDENLLLDSLFGHVKGAFTEARNDRKGAFMEADGGILFLDEIQTSTPKVQQALLRAIAMRRVRHLGSDKEITVDVRLIVATNVDLREAIAKGQFREDLYFRLKVITVNTPPLRQHTMSISPLVHHFLKEAGTTTSKTGLGLSRGALAKLVGYDWPGNIRELKHCILRAAIMAEQPIIQDTDIVLDTYQAPAQPPDTEPAKPARAAASPPKEATAPARPAPRNAAPPSRYQLNPRQIRVLPIIVRDGSITRARYQELIDGLPQRTAVHDLKGLLEQGLIDKQGNGPATRYVPTPDGITAAASLDDDETAEHGGT